MPRRLASRRKRLNQAQLGGRTSWKSPPLLEREVRSGGGTWRWRWRWRCRGQLVLGARSCAGRTEAPLALILLRNQPLSARAAPFFSPFPSPDFKRLCLLSALSGRRVAFTSVEKDKRGHRSSTLVSKLRPPKK